MYSACFEILEDSPVQCFLWISNFRTKKKPSKHLKSAHSARYFCVQPYPRFDKSTHYLTNDNFSFLGMSKYFPRWMVPGVNSCCVFGHIVDSNGRFDSSGNRFPIDYGTHCWWSNGVGLLFFQKDWCVCKKVCLLGEVCSSSFMVL